MALVSVALALAFWRVGLWSSGLPLTGHVFFLAHPLLSQVTRQLQAGVLPLWNPTAYCGVPLLADPQAEVLAPAHVVFRLFPFPAAFKLNLALDVAIGCLMAYALARRLGARRSAAAVAGLLFSCGGFFYYHSPMVAQEDALAWLPAVLLFWAGGAAAPLAIALALCYLGGNPIFVYIALAAGLALRPRRRPLLTAALAGGAALALASAQLLPALELFSRSVRSGALSAGAALVYSMPPSTLVRQLLVPLWNRSAGGFVGDPTITSFYVGLPALALAARGARRAPAAAAWALASLVLMLGRFTPLYPLLLRALPGLALFRFPAQWGALASLGVAALAAAGADRLPRGARLLAAALVGLDLWLFLGEAPTLRFTPEFFSLKPSTLAAASKGERVAHADQLLEAQANAVPEGDPQRFWLAQNEGLVPSRGSVFGLREAVSYNLYEPRDTRDFVRSALDARRLDGVKLRFLGVGAVVEGDPSGGYRVLTIDDPLARVALLGGRGGALSIVESPTRLSARTESRTPARLSWADTYFPGWRVFVDGAEGEALRTAEGFREAAVPAGAHDVRWVYASAPFSVGLALGLAVLALLLTSASSAILKPDGRP